MSEMASLITTSRLFAQTFVQAQIEEHIKAPCHWPLWGESTGVDCPHKGPVTRKMLPFDDVIMMHFHYKYIFIIQHNACDFQLLTPWPRNHTLPFVVSSRGTLPFDPVPLGRYTNSTKALRRPGAQTRASTWWRQSIPPHILGHMTSDYRNPHLQRGQTSS